MISFDLQHVVDIIYSVRKERFPFCFDVFLEELSDILKCVELLINRNKGGVLSEDDNSVEHLHRFCDEAHLKKQIVQSNFVSK